LVYCLKKSILNVHEQSRGFGTIKISKDHSIKKQFFNVHQESRGFAISKSSGTKSAKSLNPIFPPNLCRLYVHSAIFCPLEGSVCGMGRDGIHIGCLVCQRLTLAHLISVFSLSLSADRPPQNRSYGYLANIKRERLNTFLNWLWAYRNLMIPVSGPKSPICPIMYLYLNETTTF
jgi:hypothetical protein